jgi:hypothetical protein
MTRKSEENSSFEVLDVLFRGMKTSPVEVLWTVLWIRIGFNADSDPAVLVDADPNPGFPNNQITTKITAKF